MSMITVLIINKFDKTWSPETSERDDTHSTRDVRASQPYSPFYIAVVAAPLINAPKALCHDSQHNWKLSSKRMINVPDS